ncbi:MarR family transcriptional regulator [Catellatospora sp. NPDC049133]|jgi:predicted transcriptional regulator|uniref:GbsR/MarR family transcriptional regulator n=1 Tax=Catellatospora sp. NPDC049133 TaxID=3155499 RepID=UPI0033D4F3D2
MPGGRLTLQDRQRIAAGLAERLGYAEIARTLERPTSTITREVHRNGGPLAYRADRAHRAGESRARRAPAAGAAKSAPVAQAAAYGRDAEAVRAFEEQLTELTARTGLTRMAARILAHLYTTDSGSLTAAELVAHLQVSAASVSKAVGDLEQQQLIRRERDPRSRHDRYHIDGDVWYKAWLASSRMNTTLAQITGQGARILGPDTPAGARLRGTSDFLQYLGQAMLDAAEQWRRDS